MCILWFWNHLLEYNRLMQNLGEDACSSNAHQVIIGLNFLYCLSAQTIMETLSMSCRLNYDIKSNDIKSDMTPLMLKWTGMKDARALEQHSIISSLVSSTNITAGLISFNSFRMPTTAASRALGIQESAWLASRALLWFMIQWIRMIWHQEHTYDSVKRHGMEDARALEQHAIL